MSTIIDMSKHNSNDDSLSEIYVCECNKKITKRNAARHLQSESHEKRMKQIEEAKIRAGNEVLKRIDEARTEADENLIKKIDDKFKDIDKRLRKLEK